MTRVANGRARPLKRDVRSPYLRMKRRSRQPLRSSSARVFELISWFDRWLRSEAYDCARVAAAPMQPIQFS